MSGMECGCVAGVYLVATNEYCNIEDPQNNEPQNSCPSVEIMQANNYGFELSTHPCKNGECEATSMCDYKMRQQGA
jgi:hypothetical protein